MATLHIPYFRARANGDGSFRHYWEPTPKLSRLGFRTVKLSADPDTAMREARDMTAQVRHAAANNLRQRKAPTLATLCDAFEDHAHFRNLADATRKTYRSALKHARKRLGETPWQQLTPLQIRAEHAAMVKEGRPAMAAMFVSVIAAMYAWGPTHMKRFGLTHEQNPASHIRVSRKKIRRTHIWNDAEVAAMRDAATKLGCASIASMITVNVWIGQRPGDLANLRRAHLIDGILRITQQKTGMEVNLPVAIVAPVMAEIEAEQRRQLARNLLSPFVFVNEQTGQPWRDRDLELAYVAIRAEAARTLKSCADLRFCELRHTMIVACAEAGATPQQTASISGHSIATIIRRLDEDYWQRSAKQAAGGFQLRLQMEGKSA